MGAEDAQEGRGAGETPRLFGELDRRGKVVRLFAVAFAILHLGAMLVGGAIDPIKKVFHPILGFYSDALRMSNAWGMFGKPPTSTQVEVEAALADGTVVQVSTTDAHGKSWLERVRDARVRKILGRLAEDADRGRLAGPFLDYACREAARSHPDVREVRARNLLHELRDDEGKVTRRASTSILFVRRCGRGPEPPRKIPSPGLPPAPAQGGGDL